MPMKHTIMLNRRNSSPRGVSQLSDVATDSTTLSNDDAIMANKEQPSLAVNGMPQQKKEPLLSLLKRPDDIRGELEQCSSPAPSYSQRGIAMTSPTNSLKSSNSDACELLNTDTDTAMFIAAYTDADVVSAYTDDDNESERNESSIVDDHQNKVESKCVDKLQSKEIIAVDFSWKCSKSTRKAKSNPINQMMLASLVGTAASEAADAAPSTSSQEDGFSEQILDHEKGESHVKSGLINNLLASLAALSCYNVDDTRDTVILNTGLDDNPQSQPIANCVETSSPKLDEVVQERNEESDPFSVGSTLASGAALVSTRLESENDMAINDDYTRFDEGEEVEYASAVSMPDGSVNCQKPKEQQGGLTIVVYDSKVSGLESKHIIMQSVIPSVTGHTVEINEEKEEIKQLIQSNIADMSVIATATDVTADIAASGDKAIHENEVDDCIDNLNSCEPSNENHDIDKKYCSWGAMTIGTCTISNTALRKQSDVTTDAPWDETEKNGALWNQIQNNIKEEREMLTCNTAALKYILKDLGIRLFNDNEKKEKGTKEVKEEDLTVYIPETPELRQVEIKSEAKDFLSVNTALVAGAAFICNATLVDSTANDNDDAQVDNIEVSNDDFEGDESSRTIPAKSRQAVKGEAITTVKTNKSSRWTNSPKKTPKSRLKNVPTKKAKRWRAFVDPNSGKTYYSNGLITTWKNPGNTILPPSIPTSTPRPRTESRVSADSLETPATSNMVAFTKPNSLPPVINTDASLHEEEEGEEVTYSSVRTICKNVNYKKSKGSKGGLAIIKQRMLK